MLEIFQKTFRKTIKPQMLFFIVLDITLISLAVYLAFLLRFDGSIPAKFFPVVQKIIILALIFNLPVFYFLGLYSFSWSYVSAQELISLIKASTLGFLFLGAAIFISKDFPFFIGFPRSILVISYVLVLLFSGGVRFSKRVYLQLLPKRPGEKEGALIVGAGDAGEQILRSILRTKNSSYFPLGFIDDNPAKQGVIIHGLKVLGQISDIPEVVRRLKVKELIIALPSAGSKAIRRAVNMGRRAGLKKIKIVPPITEIISGEVTVTSLREVQVDDLLGREPVELDPRTIENFIRDKVVLITGAAGSIGSELSRQMAKFKPSSLLLLDQDETGIFKISEEIREKFPLLKLKSLVADIREKEKIEQIFFENSPNIVFHAAAYKHVPLMEEHPDEAVKNNIFGTEILAQTALSHRTEKFIFISTDKAVKPVSVMGATKRAGEMICQALNQKGSTRFVSVRFGNVLDSRGSVIPIFREQIKKRGPVEVTHPGMKRYFMTTSEACLLVMEAGAIGEGGEVFVLDMGKPIKILDLAKAMIQLSGFEPDKDIPIVFTKPRPGEKLFEEILTAEEGTVATQNQNIFIARLSVINEKELRKGLEELKKAIKEPDSRNRIINILKTLIPSYTPSYHNNY